MRTSFIPCLTTLASILPIFFTHAVAMEKYEPVRKSDAFWYMLGQNIDGAIVELDVNANYYGSGEIYSFLGGGLFLRTGRVHTGVRAGLNPILKWQREVPQFYAGWVLG
ncbi:MAG: hypothetical protein OEX19_09400, partial [Gammaproteobacteria bacterium]|nr:hypothetical protein [Gammaproteobacteria bacterium]